MKVFIIFGTLSNVTVKIFISFPSFSGKFAVNNNFLSILPTSTVKLSSHMVKFDRHLRTTKLLYQAALSCSKGDKKTASLKPLEAPYLSTVWMPNPKSN